MAKQVKYTASRSIDKDSSPIHMAGTQYTMTITPAAIDRTSSATRIDVESLRGDVFSTYRNIKQSWSVQLTPVTGSTASQMREFLDSVLDGSTFELDLDDGDGFIEVYMTDKSYTEKRTVRRGDGGSGDYFTFGFKCRER